MFDVPIEESHKLSWHIDAPWEDKKWNVGLIVGPSGSGKTTIKRHLFGEDRKHEWGGASVIDDFGTAHEVNDIADACMAVGFNTIPAWLRPYDVLSNGEQFRVTLAREMLDTPPDHPIVIDEFTSVVDRQVAQIGSHAAQKWVRRNDRQFVAVTCHYDVTDWLQPDWVIDAAQGTFTWRSVQPRPRVDVEIKPVPYSTWRLFAPFHYLTDNLHKGARCYALHVGEQPIAFAGLLKRPHPKAKNIMGLSRIVTLPDWQGLGAAFVLSDTIAAIYKAQGQRFRTYPAHPSLIRSYDKSPHYKLIQKPGYQSSNSKGITHGPNAKLVDTWRNGSRPCAVFEYTGPAHEDKAQALRILTKAHGRPITTNYNL
jgi:ABC-type lipoprotein export system ATPase subunit